MTKLEGRILTPEGLRAGRISIENGHIAEIADLSAADEEFLPLVLPGFIDLHCHGGGGADVMEGGDAAHQVARTHAKTGTTALLATTMTSPLPDIEKALKAVSTAMSRQGNDEAAILGVHLEGPFISRGRLGAQPDFVIDGDIPLMQRLTALADIRVITCAPEADPDGTMTRWLVAKGVRVQLGHSACSYEVAAAGFEHGCQGVTHLFNAMSPLHHRTPGLVGAALAHADYAELIPDLLHVHPGAIRAARRAIPHVYAVTDASPAAGMPDGEYRLGTQPVTRCGNGVRLADGTLAGSCLTMYEAFRNLVSIGLTLQEASMATSGTAAAYAGLEDRGRIAIGAIADLVVLSPGLDLEQVMLRGHFLSSAHAPQTRNASCQGTAKTLRPVAGGAFE